MCHDRATRRRTVWSRLILPVLEVRHITTYRYRQPVALGEHRMMFRPREGHDQRVLNANLIINPAPIRQRWMLDVFGNHVGYASFGARTTELCFDSSVTLQHNPSHAEDGTLPDLTLEDYALTYPFTYGGDEMPDLMRLIERHNRDPHHEVDRWARRFLSPNGPTSTSALLRGINQAIWQGFTYVAREEKGLQEPTTTLKLGSGSCRDFALLMMEAVRALGLAARFVSGYLHVPARGNRSNIGGGATHAWLQVFLPGAGWVEFDPTNGIVGNRDLIRVAVVREPAQAVPLSGTWVGAPSDHLAMNVAVTVTRTDLPPSDPSPQPR